MKKKSEKKRSKKRVRFAEEVEDRKESIFAGTKHDYERDEAIERRRRKRRRFSNMPSEDVGGDEAEREGESNDHVSLPQVDEPEAMTVDEAEVSGFEAFSMREELEEGVVDQDGNLKLDREVRIKKAMDRGKRRKERQNRFQKDLRDEEEEEEEEEGERDAFLDELEAYGTSKSFLAKPKVEEEEEEEEMNVLDSLLAIADILKEGENALAAMRRLPPPPGKKEKKEKGGGGEFDKLVELADGLLTSGFSNIYSMSREAILRKVGEERKKEEEKQSGVVKWDLKWYSDTHVYYLFSLYKN